MSWFENPSLQKIDQVIVQGVRFALYGVLLVVAMLSAQSSLPFTVPGFESLFVRITGIGLLLAAVGLFVDHTRWRSLAVRSALFFVDALLLFVLISKGLLTTSLILLSALLLVSAAGVAFGLRAGLAAALIASIGTSVALLLGPELRTIQFFIQLALANLGYFATALIAGYLSEELRSRGQSLEDERLLNRLILENAPVGLLLCSPKGEIHRFNPASEEILDMNSSMLSLNEVLPELKSLSRGQPELSVRRGGVERSLRLQIADCDVFQRPMKIIVIEDMTLFRRLEAAQRQSEKLAAIGQLAAGIAHEIRNPLTGISGSIQLLSGNTNAQESEKLSKIILKEIDRLNNLITEFLDYAKPETPPQDVLDLAGLVKEVISGLKLDRVHGGDQTEWIINAELGCSIRAHRDKVKQALLNILVNALQATQGRPLRQVKITVARVKDSVELRIRDSGCGIKKEQLNRIFEPFHTTKPKGTGLGLAVTHKIIESHSGRIFVESEWDQGTEFRIVFPSV